jgi:hypothetical protein
VGDRAGGGEGFGDKKRFRAGLVDKREVVPEGSTGLLRAPRGVWHGHIAAGVVCVG